MSASSVIELKQLIRRYLLQDPGVSALVSEKVYGVHLEDTEAGTVLQSGPIVVYEFISGQLRWHAGVSIQAVDLYAYSKRSLDEAGQVYDAVVEAMQHQRMQISGIDPVVLARETQRPIDGYNTQLDAWWLRGRFTLEVS